MSAVAEKHNSTIDEAIAHLVSRAENSRGLVAADLRSRVEGALRKYLFVEGSSPQHTDVKEFIGDIRADDLCLVIACERGDESAWSDLVANFDATVKSAARKITSNAEDAEDLASSIWAELYGLRTDADGNKKSKLAYYSGRGSLGGWLRAVVGQLAVDQFRKVSKFVQVEEDREFEILANEAAESNENGNSAHRTNPEQLYSEKQTSADVANALKAAIAGLDDEDRLIMKLYYFDDLKLKEIAATFGYHEATASRKLTRVQADIRKGVERELKSQHGWTDVEVRKYLSETAAGLGVNLETMFAVMMLAIFVQELYLKGVL
ncbi:MAG: sigma-70 family RNA polymerase sigma factor [Blastocatellia bacterium]|nr:sigma-70 family RNA polymerase sigma factor [Blastocatellia bacterium]